jgi:sugar phosphate isomerase/epimerase
MANKKPVLGATLYSFTNEWIQRKYDLDGLVAKVAELGLGPAVEVVGFQSIRTFPDVTDEFAGQFRGLLAKHGLIASCLGANCDIGRRKDQLMSEAETLTYLERQLVTAKKLGFPVMRIQAFVGPKVFEKLAPMGEKYGVHIACELHSPLSVDNPEVIALRERFDRVKSPFIGFIPDFSSTMNTPPNMYWENLRDMGAADGLIEETKTIWHSDKPNHEKYAALAEAGVRFKATPAVTGQLNMSMTMFGQMPPEKLAELLPYTHHIHGKFYSVDASGKETSIPYDRLMAVLKQEGYQGTISAEWEGHAFTEQLIGFSQVQAWHSMCTRMLAD